MYKWGIVLVKGLKFFLMNLELLDNHCVKCNYIHTGKVGIQEVLQRHFLKGLHTGKKDGSQDTIVELFPSPRSPWIIVHAAHGKHSGSFSKNPTSSIS